MNNADSKSFWKTITKQKTSIPRLNSPTTGLVTDSHQKANLLNSEFFKNFNYSRTPLFELASLGKDSPIISEELLCSNEEIELYLKALDTKKAAGADDISALMLKYTARASLKTLFNLSLTSFRRTGRSLELCLCLNLVKKMILPITDRYHFSQSSAKSSKDMYLKQ